MIYILTSMKEASFQNGSTKDRRQRFQKLASKELGFGRIGVDTFLEHFFPCAAQRPVMLKGNKYVQHVSKCE